MHSNLIYSFSRRFALSPKSFCCTRFHTIQCTEDTTGLTLCLGQGSYRDGSNGNLATYFVSQGFTHNNLSFRSFSKEIAVTSAKADQDLLMNSLASASSISDVLSIVEGHHSIMNTKHLIQALQSLFELQKSNSSDTSKVEVLKRPEFKMLCKSVKAQARGFELKDTLQALKVISYLEIPSSSTISQVLLQLIRHSVNDLSLSQIVFLNFLLHKMQPSPLGDALAIALPLVFEAQLAIKLDRSNVAHLAEMLQYASKKPVSSQCVETIVSSLTTLIINKRAGLDPRTAKSIVWSLCDNRKLVDAKDLVQKSLTVMSEVIDHYTFSDIEGILQKLVIKIAKKHMEFYHEDFFDSSVSYVIKKDCGVMNGIWILRKLIRISHTNIDLLNYICERIILHPCILQDCKPHILFALVTGLSNADYKPSNWEIIRNIILHHRLLAEGQLELPWLKFGSELAALGCYSSSLLERIFQEYFLIQFLSRENILDQLQLLSLYQAVVTLYPTYTGPFPPKEVIEKAAALNGEIFEQFPLEPALVKGLGGPTYLHTKVYTKLGHFIDHVIIMRRGGFPVALNPRPDAKDSRLFVEDMEVPVDSQIVAILGLQPGYYSINCSRLRGIFSLLIRTVESLNISVVPISLKMWSNLPEQEKIPYLMQEIKVKCN